MFEVEQNPLNHIPNSLPTSMKWTGLDLLDRMMTSPKQLCENPLGS